MALLWTWTRLSARACARACFTQFKILGGSGAFSIHHDAHQSKSSAVASPSSGLTLHLQPPVWSWYPLRSSMQVNTEHVCSGGSAPRLWYVKPPRAAAAQRSIPIAPRRLSQRMLSKCMGVSTEISTAIIHASKHRARSLRGSAPPVVVREAAPRSGLAAILTAAPPEPAHAF